MNRNDEVYKVGLALHGHKCPAMPLGLRAGEAAMQVLGVQHAPDGQLTALVEIDRNHCSTCFADGVQVVTGCTFGKGNIRSLGYGKFALTLVDNRTGRSVRVVASPEAMRRSQELEFIKFRKQGMPASQVDEKLVEPLIDQVLKRKNRSAVQSRAYQGDETTADGSACLRYDYLRRMRRSDRRALCPRKTRQDPLPAVRRKNPSVGARNGKR